MPPLRQSKSILLTWLLLVAGAPQVESANFHLLLVGDFEDDDITQKIFVERDLSAIRDEAYAVANALDMPVLETTFRGAVSAQEVLDWVEKMEVQPDDNLVFYFSGHGISLFSQADDPLPDLMFSGDGRGFALSSFIDLLTYKNAYFTFIFADCCNTPLPDALLTEPLLAPRRAKRLKAIETENYKKLFFDTPGIVVLCGAKRKQIANARLSGSLCTFCFLEALHEKVQDYNDIDWQDLLDSTVNKVVVLAKSLKKIQEPIFLIQP